MKLKDGVCTTRIQPELLIGLFVADGIWKSLGVELVVTSINDSRHSHTSLHYAGCAADLRIWDINANYAAKLLFEALGSSHDYDVVVEDDHIHFEWQPKLRL